MSQSGARNWLDFWNGDTPIYANERHKRQHYELIARDLAPHIPSGASEVLDYGCGEALYAPRLARDRGCLLLFDAAQHVRKKLRARFGEEAGVRVLEDGALKDVAAGSLDLIVANSLIQYIPPGELSDLLDLWKGKLKPDGWLLLADIPAPQGRSQAREAFDDAIALLRFGWSGGFFLAALASLLRLFFSDYRRLRREAGFFRYNASELESVLREQGFEGRPLSRNIGHNQNRLAFAAQKIQSSAIAETSRP